jgi:hypothetical protein
MDVLVAVGPDVPDGVGAALNISGPPPTNVVDGGEDLFGPLIDSEGSGEVLEIHGL